MCLFPFTFLLKGTQNYSADFILFFQMLHIFSPKCAKIHIHAFRNGIKSWAKKDKTFIKSFFAQNLVSLPPEIRFPKRSLSKYCKLPVYYRRAKVE